MPYSAKSISPNPLPTLNHVIPPAHSTLADQADRERFASDLESNFSVIAPAGVGKTTAIVARVAAIAQADATCADPVLPRLAVVTYTRKAAEEMQARARARLLADGAGPELLGRFSQAFFGTIHSLCLLVLKSYGHLVGLPANLEQTTALEPLWRQYLRSTDSLLHHLPEHARNAFLRHGSLSAALELVLKLPPDLPPSAPLPPPPVPDISAILATPPNKNKKAQQNIEAGQEAARRWINALHNEGGYLPLHVQKTGGKDFVTACTEAFRPLCDWLGQATLELARGVADDFRNYRKAQGKLSFDDMVSWAASVLDHPEAGNQLRRQRWCVILDEAQDTDPMQFHVLLGLAGAESAKLLTRAAPPPEALPPQGRFCMVGDPQQAIYGDRADLVTYLGVHRALAASHPAQALRFTVTMRCDQAIVCVANRIFPNLLQSTEGEAADNRPRQVAYVPLLPRPDAGPGDVRRLPLATAEDESALTQTGEGDEETSAEKRTGKADSDRMAARALARVLAAHPPAAFGAEDWSQIGILCVRNEPLGLLARALEEEGLPVQNHSRLDSRGDSPAYAWLAGLARIMAEPDNAFETAGVLREVFGICDSALYAYTVATGGNDAHRQPYHPLCLRAIVPADNTLPSEAQEVAKALLQLQEARNRAHNLPLREAAHLLCCAIDLRGRIASLPRGAVHCAELDDLLLQAAALQEQNYDWPQWADALEEGLEARLDSAEPQHGHIQLLSCHKSKGLQWPVVILAGLFRPVGYASDNFPKLLLTGRDAAPRVAFAAGHGHGTTEAALKLKAFQELQRLAYVACTRARRRMIWADDSALYEKTDGSFADALGITEGNPVNRQTWLDLPPWQPLATADNPASHARQSATGTAIAIEAAAQPRPDWSTPFFLQSAPAASARAVLFTRRVLPSALAQHRTRPTAHTTDTGDRHHPTKRTTNTSDGHHPTATETNKGARADSHVTANSNAPIHKGAQADSQRGHARDEPDGSRALPSFAELESATAGTGAEYGNWWHRAMELAPWGSSDAQWQQHAQTMLTTCPNPPRGAREWQTFTTSALYAVLNRPQMTVRCELPLLWPNAEEGIAYDGFIDLVARDNASGQWLLIDWKTDRLNAFEDPAAELLRCYGPQLEAYRKALASLFGNAPVQAHLYSTPGGLCAPPLPNPAESPAD